jgi:hypothetical protein
LAAIRPKLENYHGARHNITQQILYKSRIPYLRAEKWISAELYQMISRDVSKIVAEDREKLNLIWQLADEYLEFQSLEEMLFGQRS